jgi:hypothetical protein
VSRAPGIVAFLFRLGIVFGMYFMVNEKIGNERCNMAQSGARLNVNLTSTYVIKSKVWEKRIRICEKLLANVIFCKSVVLKCNDQIYYFHVP